MDYKVYSYSPMGITWINKCSISAYLGCLTRIESPVSMIRIPENPIKSYGDGSKPWYLVNPKIAGKGMFIPLKMYL